MLPSATAAGKRSRMAASSAAERRHAGDRAQRGEQRRPRHRAPEVLARELGGGHLDQPAGDLEIAARVDEHGTVREAGEDVDGVEQRHVLDHERVRVHDRLARSDRAVVDAAEGHHGRAGALGPEDREGLGVAAVVEGGDGEQFGGGDDALAAAPVDAYLEHGRTVAQRRRRSHPLWSSASNA